MGGRQDEVIKQHEGKVMMQKDLEAAREEVARMAKEVTLKLSSCGLYSRLTLALRRSD